MAYPKDLKPEQVEDLVADTQDLIIKKGQYTNLLSDLNDYVAVRELMGRHKKTFEGGMDWTFNVAIGENNKGNGTARHVKLFQDDTANRVDVIKKGSVKPRFTDANYVFDVREPVLNSGNMVKVIDFVKEQMHLMYQSHYDLMENDFWGAPANKAEFDELAPAGLAYWIQRMSNADAANASYKMGGFRGLDPMLATSATVSTKVSVPRAGISSATYPRWANWCAQYAAVSKDDLIKKMRYAVRKTKFRSPLRLAEPKLGSGRGIYVNIDTLAAMEEILEAQNMNLGNDLAAKDGKTLFKGNPVEYVPSLDDDAEAPVYLIDWSTLCIGTLAGWAEHISRPKDVPHQHNSRQVFLDSGVNFACTNLRNQAVISKAAA